MDPKKCLEMTEVDFRQKLEISILISKKFEFFIFSKFEGLFAGTFERVKVAKKVKTLSFVKNSSSSPRKYLHNRKRRTDAQDTISRRFGILRKTSDFTAGRARTPV